MKKLAFIFLAAIVFPIHAQPGYLGKKGVIEVTGIFARNVAEEGGLRLPFFYSGIKYERIFNDNKGWSIGLSFVRPSKHIFEREYGSGYSQVELLHEDNFGDVQSYEFCGPMNYGSTDISIMRKWYFGPAGAVAPYGLHYGLGLDYCMTRVLDASEGVYINGNSGTLTFPISDKYETQKSLYFMGMMGNRRMLGSRISLSYHVSMGFALQSADILRYSYDAVSDSHERVEEYLAARHLAKSKLIQVGIGLGYLL